MRWFACTLLLFLAATVSAMQGDPAAKPTDKNAEADTFYSGTVSDFSETQLVVLRTVLGKSEKRTFVINETTKVEGKLRQKIRVTVKFEKSDAGDVAKLVRVRVQQVKKK